MNDLINEVNDMVLKNFQGDYKLIEIHNLRHSIAQVNLRVNAPLMSLFNNSLVELSANIRFYVLQKFNRDINQDILNERKRQDTKWGVQNHNLDNWLFILMEEWGEACEAFLDIYFKNEEPNHVIEELVQTAAVSQAILEFLKRNPQLNIKKNEPLNIPNPNGTSGLNIDYNRLTGKQIDNLKINEQLQKTTF